MINLGPSITITDITNGQELMSKTRVLVCLFQAGQLLYDDNDVICAFNSSCHDPNSSVVAPTLDQPIVLDAQSNSAQIINNKLKNDRVVFKEKYKFYINLLKQM